MSGGRSNYPAPKPTATWLLTYRRPVVVAIHVLLVVLANYLAFWLRFDGQIPAFQYDRWLRALPVLLAARLLVFIPFRLYQGLWRYTSVWDLRDIIAGVVSSSALFVVLVRSVLQIDWYPRSIYIIDAVLLILLMGGVRMTRRLFRRHRPTDGGKRVLIYGAGDAGEMIVRDMKNNPFYHYEPVGFVDDDRRKVGQRIHGVPVLGGRDDLARIVERKQPDEVLIAMPAAETGAARSIVRALEPFKVRITTLPNLRDIFDGKVTVSHIRSLSIEDLLPRAPIGLDDRPVRELIAGETVLVTGAGGSIGSELCRQILGFGPKALVLFERYENGLYAIDAELRDRSPGARIHSLIGDINDARRLGQVLERHRPDILFHAAAHKHVPLMEDNPCEAVKNNVVGTWTTATLACRYGVKRFVMISTDKAVNPTSVMGATKRVAEFAVQSLASGVTGTPKRLTVVRFGNVLGSNGSVVPRFVEQIRAGGPVTVTHPEIKRYFMLISEAVQLVLHAAAMAEGAEVFVLDMGEQIKLADLARNLIRLSGYVPDEDIRIEYVGLRPGEKLYEDLVGIGEVAEPSQVDKIRVIRPAVLPDPALVEESVFELERLASEGDAPALVAKLGELVPTFRLDHPPLSVSSDSSLLRAELAVTRPRSRPPGGRRSRHTVN